MARFWLNISMQFKLTLGFIIFILIPLTATGIYSYQLVMDFAEAEASTAGASILQQVYTNISGKLDIVESVSDNLAYNATLKNFLSEDFVPNPYTIDVYINTIAPLLEYAISYHKVNIDRIILFTANETIPEGFNLLYHESDSAGARWRSQFAPTSTSMWLPAAAFGPAPKDYSSGYSYFQRIKGMDNRELGIIEIHISNRDVMEPLDEASPGSEFFLIGEDGTAKRPSGAAFEIPTAVRTSIAGKATATMIIGSNLFVTRRIDRLHSIVGIRRDLGRTMARLQTIPRLAALICFVILAMVITFFIMLQKIFFRIRRYLGIMEWTVGNGFNLRIKAVSDNEIDRIARQFNALLDTTEGLVTRLVAEETAHKDAQLRALQLQINPHFIYNTIEIYADRAALSGNFDLADSIADFGKMLRYNIGSSGSYSSLGDEIAYSRAYIGIQGLKYNGALSLDVEVDSSIQQERVIRFILQPIVENSISHNAIDQEHPLAIHIGAERFQGGIRVIIQDNGRGIGEAKLRMLNQSLAGGVAGEGTGIGLSNISERLRLFYGERYGVRIESEEGAYARTVLTFPSMEERGTP